ncbi:MAG: hypothetical protein AAGJ35_13525, partial [Myxococcota bacterium]
QHDMHGLLNDIADGFRSIGDQYPRAYKQGKVRRWAPYYASISTLKQIQKVFVKHRKTHLKVRPKLRQALDQSMVKLEHAIAKKAPPSRVRQHSFSAIRALYMNYPQWVPREIRPIQNTLRVLQQNMQAESTVANTRVGIRIEPKTILFQTYKTRYNEAFTRPIRMAPKATHMVRVFLRRQDTGDLIHGTHVSVELLNAKTKKQKWSRKMIAHWQDIPSYVLPLKLPKASAFLLQVTVSPFPFQRSQATRTMLRTRSIHRFRIQRKGQRLLFQTKTPSPALRLHGGPALLQAYAQVPRPWKRYDVLRVGVAIRKAQPHLAWKSGSLKTVLPTAKQPRELVAYVHNIKTGVLLPNTRLKAFIYWQSPKYGRFRSSFQLEPIFNHFPGYRTFFS